MTRRRLREQFIAFRATSMAEGCPDYQVRDMERAFMAGCAGMYRVCVQSLASKDVITPQDISMVKDVIEELNTFNRGLVQ